MKIDKILSETTHAKHYPHREQAQQYVGEPSASDPQRGLKRSWKSTTDQNTDAGEGTSGSASSAKKPSPEEKGKI